MNECSHQFIGTHSGVYCTRCGKQMTAAEYVRYLHPEGPEAPKPEKPAPRRGGRKRGDAK